MSKIIKTGQILTFIKEATNFLDKLNEIEESYRWVQYSTKDAVYVPLDDNPIYISVQRDEMPITQDPRDTRRIKVSEEVSDDTLKEKMETTKTILQFPENGSAVAYPVGECAIHGVYERVGLACPTMTSTSDTSRRDEASPFNKALAYDALRRYTKGNTLLRVGDEQILGCMSEEYVIIPIPDAIKTVKETLENKFEFVEFIDGQICRETTSAEFAFEDYDLQKQISEAFERIGVKTKGMRPYVKIITSDVGVSGANLFAFLKNETGKIIPVGLPEKMEHKGDASLEKLSKNVDVLFESFAGISEMIKELEDIKISNPADCVYNIGKKAKLPEKTLREGAEEFDGEYPYSCSGADVFRKLFEIFSSVAAEGKLSDYATMTAMENITRACLKSMKAYDEPVVKDGKVVGVSAAA